MDESAPYDPYQADSVSLSPEALAAITAAFEPDPAAPPGTRVLKHSWLGQDDPRGRVRELVEAVVAALKAWLRELDDDLRPLVTP